MQKNIYDDEGVGTIIFYIYLYSSFIDEKPKYYKNLWENPCAIAEVNKRIENEKSK